MDDVENMLDQVEADQSRANVLRYPGNLTTSLERAAKKAARRKELGLVDLAEDSVALSYMRKHMAEFRFDVERGKWYQWDASRWAIDRTLRAFDAARVSCRDIATDGDMPEKKREKIKSYSFVSAIERFARSSIPFAVPSDVWDRDDMMLGTPGGTIDVARCIVRDASPDDMITRQTAVAPADLPECPVWMAFLEQATNGDADLIRFLQAWCGYTLTGSTREHALLFIYGPGGNGKSVFLNTIAGIMGEYCETAAMDTFTASKYEKHSTDIASLAGARMVCCSETEEGKAWAEARIKSLTGGDKIKARFMRQDNFEFMPKFKLVIVGNHRPVLHNIDDAARRRFNIVPFLHKPTTPDRNLETKLRAEWPAILRWMMDGAADWLKNGLTRPQVVIDATAEYFSEQDLTAQWIDECCIVGNGQSDTQASLFASWSDYARSNGEHPGSSKAFSQALLRANHAFRQTKNTPGTNGKRGFFGIAVRPPDPDSRSG